MSDCHCAISGPGVVRLCEATARCERDRPTAVVGVLLASQDTELVGASSCSWCQLVLDLYNQVKNYLRGATEILKKRLLAFLGPRVASLTLIRFRSPGCAFM